jgi:hypothetical protein
MRHYRRALPILLIAALAAVAVAGLAYARHHAAQVVYYPETGHSVRAPFLDFFEAHGGVAFFGYPLTEAYVEADSTTGQIFQRAQLRLTPRGVALGPIGEALWLSEPRLAREDSPEGSRYVASTGHAIASELLPFYDEHGGSDFFGAPIGEARTENGALAQDFARARLIRNALGDYELGMLGAAYIDVHPPPTGSTILAAPPREAIGASEVRASVSVQYPTVEHDGQQTIFLVVQDENGLPVANARSLAMLRYEDASAEIELPPTDDQGVAAATFIVPPAPPGTRVVVELYVLVGDTFLTVETTYIQWW